MHSRNGAPTLDTSRPAEDGQETPKMANEYDDHLRPMLTAFDEEEVIDIVMFARRLRMSGEAHCSELFP